MDIKSSISRHDWHIPRPSLSGSGSTSISDTRSRGGSASSQGSSSNHSTHSASSGSLLLNAANLARMSGKTSAEEHGHYQNKLISYDRKPGICDAVVSIPEEPHDTIDNIWSGVNRATPRGHDAASIASSTHFTVVNGYTKQLTNKAPKSCCCDQSHQITILVISMTILFSACILAAICFVEMRMRKETGIYKYS